MNKCKSIQCKAMLSNGDDFCYICKNNEPELPGIVPELTLAQRYPQYYKPVGDIQDLDVYAVHYLFQLIDPTGCLHHASKKILLSGVRTGGKSAFKDIKEARDTLTRWMQLNPERPIDQA